MYMKVIFERILTKKVSKDSKVQKKDKGKSKQQDEYDFDDEDEDD
jgi:hypothetical protein